MKTEVKMKVLVMNCSPVRNGATAEIVNIVTDQALWNSSENNLYGIDKKKAIKCIPDIENYEYVPVNNSMLAKAEIPFLIFERNRGKCFIEMY